jgi:hypothetical protein
MSVEITLHLREENREQVRQLLEELGYKPCEHLWEWPHDSLNYHWFDDTDYRSFDGVEANIYRPSAEEEKRSGDGEWALHTRVRALAVSMT